MAILIRLVLFHLVYNPEWCGGLVSGYKAVAENVLERHGFSMMIRDRYVPKVLHPPGYPLFLAGVFALFGKSVGNYEKNQISKTCS